ncbi:porin family protein [Hymenobacter chitinivorans]|uniref:Outer membrane protein with beta-barrel domain n=1 Tax=Hymenobacter chitinivorans DSM 11115 TaxID=1121954 RepID=A0A2M9AT02_9BACT|nr:porin family protein [Hymenobacter chitinivorans]PJJ48802.1 outer membrane protein with beta-barrel domain [Hymenobacter chitinivorans DSM 11115]
MKKAFLIAFSLLLMASTSQAQLLRVGLKFGGNVSNAVGYDARKSNWRAGGHGGVMVQLRPTFLPKWSVQTEALYTMKGDNSVTYGPSLMARLDYLDVPVLLQYHWDDIFFEAGPQFSKLLSSTANPSVVTPPDFNPMSYGFAVGFGFQDKSGVQIGWRYNADLTNVTQSTEVAGEPVQTRLRNSVMELYLGYNVGTGQLGSALADAGTGIGRGAKFLVTAPFRLFRKKNRPTPTETPAAAPAAPATAPAPAVPKPE